jgi:hypothetical protein
MNYLDQKQKAALEHAMSCAAEFLAECGTSDLAKLTPEQAEEFGVILICRYGERTPGSYILDDDIPFR